MLSMPAKTDNYSIIFINSILPYTITTVRSTIFEKGKIHDFVGKLINKPYCLKERWWGYFCLA